MNAYRYALKILGRRRLLRPISLWEGNTEIDPKEIW
jgi:hypothetical protein